MFSRFQPKAAHFASQTQSTIHHRPGL